jgi:hypothetical protein
MPATTSVIRPVSVDAMRTSHTTGTRLPRRLTRVGRPALLLTATVLVALGFTGCTVSFQPADAGPSPSAPASDSEKPSGGTTDESGEGTDPGGEGVETPDGDSPRATREYWQPRVSRIVTCVDGRADITADATALELAADCDTVTIAGAGVIVLAQKVGSLTVTADASTVIVAEADAIDVSGVGNEVLWEAGDPTVSDTGTMNVVLPADRS